MTASFSTNHCAGPPVILRHAIGVALAALLSFTLFIAGPPSASAQNDAEITFINAIPGISLDVVADGDILAEGVNYGEQYDISATAGLTVDELELRETGDSEAFLDAQGTIADEGNWTMVAHLEDGGSERVSLFNNNVDAVDAGDGRLTIRHVADAGPLDIFLDDSLINPSNSGGLASGKQLGADITANNYTLRVLDSQTQEPLFDDQEIEVYEGESFIVYIVGAIDDHATVDQLIPLGGDADPDPTSTPEDEPDDPTPTPSPTPPEEIMTEGDEVDSTPPESVDTGIGMMTVTRFSPERTAGLVVLVLLGVATTARFVRRRQRI